MVFIKKHLLHSSGRKKLPNFITSMSRKLEVRRNLYKRMSAERRSYSLASNADTPSSFSTDGNGANRTRQWISDVYVS
jgi:hypothetical protein